MRVAASQKYTNGRLIANCYEALERRLLSARGAENQRVFRALCRLESRSYDRPDDVAELPFNYSWEAP